MATQTDRTVRPREATALLAHCMRYSRPSFLWGPPGIGKSELLEQIGANWDRPVDLEPGAANPNARPIIDMRLLLMDPTDIKGIPYFDSNEGVMKWAPSSELPAVIDEAAVAAITAQVAEAEHLLATITADTALDEFTKHQQVGETRGEIAALSHKLARIEGAYAFQNAILFLDEMNSAPPSVQGAAYQLILNRRVGEYVLPEGVSIVAAGNRDTDKGVTFRMPTPLANRFVHFEMTHNFEDWQKWAVNNGVHPDVVGFLSHHKQKLFSFDPKSGDKAFATPRSWVFVSDLISDSLPDSMNSHLVAGTVGEGFAIEFMAHRKIAAKMPKPDDVLFGKVKKLEVDEISAKYSLTVSMCYSLKEMQKRLEDDQDKDYTPKDWNNCIDNFFAFMMENFEPEMTILGAKTAVRDYNLPIKHRELKTFKEFYNRYGKYIMDD